MNNDRLEIGEVHDDPVMPLVLCRSRGGRHDDNAFESGWRLGAIGATLAGPGVSALAESIRPGERLQADLLAMACGYGMTVESSDDPDRLAVTFTRARLAIHRPPVPLTVDRGDAARYAS